MIKYRVNYYESDSWSTDSWNTDYDTEDEAMNKFRECWDEYMDKPYTPSYYILPTYIGKITI